MKIAILTVTDNGLELAEYIKAKLDHDYTVIRCDIHHKNIMKNIEEDFKNYDGIISIMATGITIRAIAPYVQSKVSDPAVLAIDEKGKYVVSLLSGHLGGGNALCGKIAKIINGEAVISTSTDVNFKYGIDSIASRYFYTIDDTKKILPFNKAILENIPLNIRSDKYLSYLTKYFTGSTFNQVNIDQLSFDNKDLNEDEDIYSSTNDSSENELVQSSDKDFSTDEDGLVSSDDNDNIDDIPLSIVNFSFEKDNEIHNMNMKEKKLVIGIGSRRGKTKEKVILAIEEAIKNLNIPLSRVNSIATISIKKDELGIINATSDLDKKLEIIDIDVVRNFHSDDCSKSDFLYEKFQIDGVCEQCAMIAAGEDSKLIHRKLGLDGVTVAVAISK